jgi:hypothetical protein
VLANAFEEEPMRVSRNIAIMVRALVLLGALSVYGLAEDNPMWRS